MLAYVVFKILVGGFLSTMAIPIHQKHQIPQNGTLSRSRRVCFVCPHETAHGRSYECITGIMYAQTYIHVPRNKLIVARFCILMNLIFTYLIS